ncbi:hypothetical protein SAMN05421810_102524 [Amycolatopsis arida]|uniref:Transmembrane protein n=1 Tax=Amycolatopsis arida TaxID=587909 RepID=A0A1I5Q6Q3_9PSEU|nr:gephyrin-like molybdotransferase receptor GlpR [Amycolatopsis arida]TDX98729.1 hypothetical protein CLV69_101525 [Amycolatopsis arida]SFP41671.1 hypothetical protein SAMN05421810_102524 [Amycolatopsis arida]
MPSSLIIVALAAAWLVVLVPMIARKRQEIVPTNDSALAARVVRSGGADIQLGGREEYAVPEKPKPDEPAGADEDMSAAEPFEADEFDDGFDDDVDDLDEEPAERPVDETPRARPTTVPAAVSGSGRRYRPGRGGFDPEAAEMAARAKYAYRQRVVLVLLALVIVTAVLAGFLWSALWWANGAADVVLVGYLIYLRRQVRIEDEIRQRRLARLNTAARRPAREPRRAEEVEIAERRRAVVGSERKPVPTSRVRRQAVVVDIDDEDPAFHELAEPNYQPYRRAAGE